MSKQELFLKNNEVLWTSDLEEVLSRHELMLTHLADLGHPLTEQRLAKWLPEASSVIEKATQLGLEWPTVDTAVPVHIGAKSRDYFGVNPVVCDANFAEEASIGETSIGKKASEVARTKRGFNNFVALLATEPFMPEGIEDFTRRYSISGRKTTFGSKPYLLRAYAMAPEFMSALNYAVNECGGMENWAISIDRGACEPEIFPENAVLLRSSRLAYGLLMNLMRTDDLRRQSDWFGLDGSAASLIEDAEIELRT